MPELLLVKVICLKMEYDITYCDGFNDYEEIAEAVENRRLNQGYLQEARWSQNG